MNEYFYDEIDNNSIIHKGRVYNVIDKNGNHLWYEWTQKSVNANGESIFDSSFTDFLNGNWLGLTQEEKYKSLMRVVKLS